MLRSFAVSVSTLLVVFFIGIPGEAHMPGAKPPPKFILKPIVMTDGGIKVKITIDDVGNYHNERMKKIRREELKNQGRRAEEIDKAIEKEFAGAEGKCPCTSFAFRAALLGIQEVWGKEIPERGEIEIISRLPTPGSVQCFQYITGTEPAVPNVNYQGEFRLILPDKTEITDLSLDYLNELSKDMDINNWDFIISRRFKSEEFEIQVKEGLHPENFFNLREKVKIKNTATEEEIEEFRIIWEDTRDTFLTKTDWELFKGVEKPFPVGGAIFFSMLVIGTGSLFFGMHRYKSKIVPKTKELERGWKV